MSGTIVGTSGTNHPVKFDADRKARFLTIYRLTGQLQRAARETGISPSTVRAHLKEDLDFRAAADEAYGDFRESVEGEVMRRAIMGWDEPVYQQGMLAGSVRKYDSRLLELLVKRHIPEFREKFEIAATITPGTLAVPAQGSWERYQEVEAVEEEGSGAQAHAASERDTVFRGLGAELAQAADPEGDDRGEVVSGEDED